MPAKGSLCLSTYSNVSSDCWAKAWRPIHALFPSSADEVQSDKTRLIQLLACTLFWMHFISVSLSLCLPVCVPTRLSCPILSFPFLSPFYICICPAREPAYTSTSLSSGNSVTLVHLVGGTSAGLCLMYTWAPVWPVTFVACHPHSHHGSCLSPLLHL